MHLCIYDSIFEFKYIKISIEKFLHGKKITMIREQLISMPYCKMDTYTNKHIFPMKTKKSNYFFLVILKANKCYQRCQEVNKSKHERLHNNPISYLIAYTTYTSTYSLSD